MSGIMNSIPKNNNSRVVENKSQLFQLLKKYVLLPLKEGLYGFIIVFAVIAMVKLLSFLLGINDSFNFDLMDVLLSAVGFFFLFLVYFLKKADQ
jgi:hypothetical protein